MFLKKRGKEGGIEIDGGKKERKEGREKEGRKKEGKKEAFGI